MAVTVFDPNLFQFNVFQIGNPETTGDVSVTLGNVTCVSNTVGSRSAVLNVTLGAVQAQSTATILVTGNVSAALDGVTLVAYGDTFQETTVTVTLDDVTCSAAETIRTRAITTRRTRNWQITKRAA